MRRVLPFGELDQLLAGAERLAYEVNRAKRRKAQRLIRETEELYGDESILETKHEFHKLLKAAKDRRTRGKVDSSVRSSMARRQSR